MDSVPSKMPLTLSLPILTITVSQKKKKKKKNFLFCKKYIEKVLEKLNKNK